MQGKTRLKPKRLVRSWTGNSAARKQTSWIVVPSSHCQLVSFGFLPGEKNDGTNLHMPVELTLKSAEGKESKSKVVYVVGTSPVVTVIRE